MAVKTTSAMLLNLEVNHVKRVESHASSKSVITKEILDNSKQEGVTSQVKSILKKQSG